MAVFIYEEGESKTGFIGVCAATTLGDQKVFIQQYFSFNQ
jgi:hypothetical protein